MILVEIVFDVVGFHCRCSIDCNTFSFVHRRYVRNFLVRNVSFVAVVHSADRVSSSERIVDVQDSYSSTMVDDSCRPDEIHLLVTCNHPRFHLSDTSSLIFDAIVFALRWFAFESFVSFVGVTGSMHTVVNLNLRVHGHAVVYLVKFDNRSNEFDH